MGGEKKPLVMSDLGCADGCGRQMGAEKLDGCGRRGCKGMAGNGWGEEAAGDERPWLRRTAADGKWVRRTARMAADGVGATEWLEMGGEKGKEGKGWERKGTGRERKGQEGKGRERMGKAGKGKKPLVMSDLGCADGCGLQMGAEKCADGCGRRGCKGVAGNGWREEAAGDERPWLRGRLRTGNGCGELRGRLRTAWVQRSGCRNGWGEEAAGDERPWLRGRLRTAKCIVRRTARTAADGVGARGWLEMGWEKKRLVMSDLGCARGCGRQMGAENCVDGCGRRGVQRSGWKWVGRRSRW